MEAEILESELNGGDVSHLSQPLADSFVHKRIIGAVGGFLGGGPLGAVTGFLGGGVPAPPTFSPPQTVGSTAGKGLGFGITSAQCPPGTRAGADGQCRVTGVRGTLERAFPFGRTGTRARTAGDGLVSLLSGGPDAPMEVGTITRNDGSVGPILRCPPGMVLAIDDLCYAKGLKGLAQFRKWKPGSRPFLTGGERKILLRAQTLRKGKSTKKTLKALGLG